MRALATRCLTTGGLLALLLGLLGCSVCVRVQDCCPRRTGADQIGIDIPDAVQAGVLKALPGFVVTGIEMESEDGGLIYEFEGHADGVRYEVEVDGEGNVLEIETDSDEDEEDHEDD